MPVLIRKADGYYLRFCSWRNWKTFGYRHNVCKGHSKNKINELAQHNRNKSSMFRMINVKDYQGWTKWSLYRLSFIQYLNILIQSCVKIRVGFKKSGISCQVKFKQNGFFVVSLRENNILRKWTMLFVPRYHDLFMLLVMGLTVLKWWFQRLLGVERTLPKVCIPKHKNYLKKTTMACPPFRNILYNGFKEAFFSL